MLLLKNQVHPHVCGEHTINVCRLILVLGSSPRVWGTFPSPIPRTPGTRFIPTCVGNIGSGRACVLFHPVHPHVCGEHLTVVYYYAHRHGSSPRVWGTYSLGNKPTSPGRFIPTCVGNMSIYLQYIV